VTDSQLSVAHLTAAPGEKTFGLVDISVDGQTLHMPIFLVNGREPGPTLAITAGVHAAEYASIAAALDVARALSPGELRGQVIVLPIVNVPGFSPRSIYVCPLDGKNPNRYFPGNAEGGASEQLAAWVFENVIKQGDYYVDLHGGDLIEALMPFTLYHQSGNEAVDKASLELARVFGIPYIVRSETLGSTYSAAARAGIPAILTEAGGNGLWSPEEVALHRDGLDRLMHHLGLLAGPASQPGPTVVCDRFVWSRSQHAGFWYPAVKVGQEVREGDDLGQVRDYEGNLLQTASSPANGAVLFLVTSLAINPNDPLLAVGA
jgi:uncharacterized protein